MKKLKVIIFIVLILFVCLISLGIIYKHNSPMEQESTSKKWFREEKIYLTVCPTSGLSESYIIELHNNGVIKTYYGIREENEIDVTMGNFDIEIEKQEEVYLEDTELKKIDNMLLDIKSNKKGEKKRYFDSWEYILWVGNEKYYRYHADKKEDKVVEFIQLLMDLSPVDVNLHDFA